MIFLEQMMPSQDLLEAARKGTVYTIGPFGNNITDVARDKTIQTERSLRRWETSLFLLVARAGNSADHGDWLLNLEAFLVV